MKIRSSLLALLALCFAQSAFGTVPAFVKSSTAWSLSTTGGITPINSGDTLLIPIFCFGTGTIGTPTDSSGATPILDGSTAHWSFYRETGVTTVAHTLTFTSTGCTSSEYLMVEVSGLGPLDKITSEATGTGTAVTSNSLTPTTNNDFVLSAVANASSPSYSAWTNSFTQNKALISGPSAVDAYLVQTSGPTSINAGVTLSFAETWYTVLAAYSPSTGPTAKQAASGFFISP